MKAVVVDMLLAIGVLSAWLGAFAFVRLTTALDRLHCSTFVAAAAGGVFTLAACVEEGVTQRTLKFALLFCVILISGAATSHAIGRALFSRDGERG